MLYSLLYATSKFKTYLFRKSYLEPLAVAVSWLMTHCGWLAVVSTAAA